MISWQRRLFRFLLAAVLVLVPGELLMRRIKFAPAVPHPVLGGVPEPGSVSYLAREGNGRSTWTVDGIRRKSPLDPTAPTILALGDSYTEAAQIDDEEVFNQPLEEALRQAGHPFQVLNAAGSGYSAADYVDRADFFRGLGKNRWTIIQLRDADLEEDAWTAGKTRFVRKADGKLAVERAKLRESVFGGVFRPLLNNSALVSYGLQRFLEFRLAAAAEQPLFRAADTQGVATPPAPERYPVEEELELLERTFEGRVTFLYLATYDADDPLGGGRTDVERRFEALCRSRAWSCVNLRDAFPEFAERKIAPFGFSNTSFNKGHMNAAGHRASAELLEREMERLLDRDLL